MSCQPRPARQPLDPPALCAKLGRAVHRRRLRVRYRTFFGGADACVRGSVIQFAQIYTQRDRQRSHREVPRLDDRSGLDLPQG